VDASLFAVGAVLFQKDNNGKRRPVSYYSAVLNAAEQNYDIWDRKFLAMIKGLKHNQHLLVGSPHKVVVLTDHENLRHYHHPQKINRRVARYLHYLVDFDLELRHIPGMTNKADGLSRRPDHDDRSQDNEEIIALPDSLFVQVVQMKEMDEQVQECQKSDQDIFNKWKQVHSCKERSGILYKDNALVVTAGGPICKEILQQYHDSITARHPGVWKTFQAIRKDYWWPSLQEYIKEYIKGCVTCQQNKTITQRNKPPLQPITPEEDAKPFSTLAMDFVIKLYLFISRQCERMSSVSYISVLNICFRMFIVTVGSRSHHCSVRRRWLSKVFKYVVLRKIDFLHSPVHHSFSKNSIYFKSVK
jgi:hypothetical protein